MLYFVFNAKMTSSLMSVLSKKTFWRPFSWLYIFQTSVHKIMFYILKTESRVKCINDSLFKPKQGILLIHHELDWHKMFNHLKHFDISHGLG